MKMNKTLVGILIGVVVTAAVFLVLSQFNVSAPQVAVQESDAATFRLPANFLKLSPGGVTVFVNGKMVQPTVSNNPNGVGATFNYTGEGGTVSGSYTFSK